MNNAICTGCGRPISDPSWSSAHTFFGSDRQPWHISCAEDALGQFTALRASATALIDELFNTGNKNALALPLEPAILMACALDGVSIAADKEPRQWLIEQLRAYLERAGWRVRVPEHSRIVVCSHPTEQFEDGEPVHVVLPLWTPRVAAAVIAIISTLDLVADIEAATPAEILRRVIAASKETATQAA